MQERKFELDGYSIYWFIIPVLIIIPSIFHLFFSAESIFENFENIIAGLLILGLIAWIYEKSPKTTLVILEKSIKVIKRNELDLKTEYSDIRKIQFEIKHLILNMGSNMKKIYIGKLNYEKLNTLKTALKIISEKNGIEVQF